MSEWKLVGVERFNAALKKIEHQALEAARQAVLDAAHMVEREAKQNSTGPARWRKEVTEGATVKGRSFTSVKLKSSRSRAQGNAINFPREGGPGVVSGAHRRSIHVVGPIRTSGGGFRAQVGPSMIYSRALELGNPRWNRSGGYPYMRPALEEVTKHLPHLFKEAWKKAMKTHG